MKNIVKITKKSDEFHFEPLIEVIDELEAHAVDLNFLSTIHCGENINENLKSIFNCVNILKKVGNFDEI